MTAVVIVALTTTPSRRCFRGLWLLWLSLWCEFSIVVAFLHYHPSVFRRTGKPSPAALQQLVRSSSGILRSSSSSVSSSTTSHQQPQPQPQHPQWCDTSTGEAYDHPVQQQQRQLQDAIFSHVDALLWSSQEEQLGVPQMMPVEELLAADLQTAQDSCLALEEEQGDEEKTTNGSSSPPAFPCEWVRVEHYGDDSAACTKNGDTMDESGTCSKQNEQQSANKKCYYPLAVRSTGAEPLLDAAAVTDIRAAAEQIWNRDAAAAAAASNTKDGGTSASSSSSSSSSRFTYQYPGNAEAHVFDFFDLKTSAGRRAVAALNAALQSKIYPLVRSAFLGVDSNSTAAAATLFVYDALVIRYNATAAARSTAAAAAAASPSPSTTMAAAAGGGAGQPLHRDRGLVSVNIMLNDNKTDFRGGGTFFENQLLGRLSSNINSVSSGDRRDDDDDDVHDDPTTTTTTKTTPIAAGVLPRPLHPRGVGHCLAHRAAERHAGAGTVAGVRDILVLFVSAAATSSNNSSSSSSNSSNNHSNAIRAALLKQCRGHCTSHCQPQPQQQQQDDDDDDDSRRLLLSSVLCRIRHQRLAVQASNGQDGEAFQYLGTALMEYADLLLVPQRSAEEDDDDDQQQQSTLQAALHCFQCAAHLTPCDARVYNNWAIVLNRLQEVLLSNCGADADASQQKRRQLELQRERAYQRALELLRWSSDAGCNVAQDLDSLSLNYGLFLANQDRYRAACRVLQPTAAKYSNRDDGGVSTAASSSKTIGDAHRLWKWCKEQL